jgi:hypothetical protein
VVVSFLGIFPDGSHSACLAHQTTGNHPTLHTGKLALAVVLCFSFFPNDLFIVAIDDSFGQLWAGFPPVLAKSSSIPAPTFLMKPAFFH